MRRGGTVLLRGLPTDPAVGKFSMHADLPAGLRAKRLGGSTFKLADRIAIITPKMVWDAILTGKPYPVKALQLHARTRS